MNKKLKWSDDFPTGLLRWIISALFGPSEEEHLTELQESFDKATEDSLISIYKGTPLEGCPWDTTAGNNKVPAIKWVRAQTGFGLKEAKVVVEEVMEDITGDKSESAKTTTSRVETCLPEDLWYL